MGLERVFRGETIRNDLKIQLIHVVKIYFAIRHLNFR